MIEQRAFGSLADDHVRDQAGEEDVIAADGEQHGIGGAVRGGEEFPKLGDLAGNRAAARGRCAVAVDLARPLRPEQAVGDRRAGATERNVGHGEVWVLDGQRQRGARLIAVE